MGQESLSRGNLDVKPLLVPICVAYVVVTIVPYVCVIEVATQQTGDNAQNSQMVQ